MCGPVNMSVDTTGGKKQYVCAPAGLPENIYPGGWFLGELPAPPCTEYLWEPVHFSEHGHEFSFKLSLAIVPSSEYL